MVPDGPWSALVAISRGWQQNLLALRTPSELMGSTGAPELVMHIDHARYACRHLPPHGDPRGINPGSRVCSQNEVSGAEIAGGRRLEPVGFGLGLGVPPVKCQLRFGGGLFPWTLADGLGRVDSGKCRHIGVLFHF